MSSLNSVDEINLAEKIIDIHPWSEMARFTEQVAKQTQLQ